MFGTIEEKNEKLLRKLMRGIGISEKKFEEVQKKCIEELGENGENKWSKAQIAQVLMEHWMNEKSGFSNF